jgi:hypothetical protein
MKIVYSTLEEMKKVADNIELRGVDFLDVHGARCKTSRKKCYRVKFVFIDGTIVNMRPTELKRGAGTGYKFLLRPKVNN